MVLGIRNLESSEALGTWTRGFHRSSRMGARLDRAKGVSEIKGKWRVWTTLVKFYKCSGNREKRTEAKGRCELISGGESGNGLIADGNNAVNMEKE